MDVLDKGEHECDLVPRKDDCFISFHLQNPVPMSASKEGGGGNDHSTVPLLDLGKPLEAFEAAGVHARDNDVGLVSALPPLLPVRRARL